MQNKIYAFFNKDNLGILKFPKCNIETDAYFGINGVTNTKREGDGKTPLGEFELGIALGMHSITKIKNNIDYKQINDNMFWVDDPKSRHYNKLVDTLKVEKDWVSAEHLIDYTIQYEYLIEIKLNPKNIPGNGSAIFLHCTNNKPTAGCIAVNREIMKQILENIDSKTKIQIKDRRERQIKN